MLRRHFGGICGLDVTGEFVMLSTIVKLQVSRNRLCAEERNAVVSVPRRGLYFSLAAARRLRFLHCFSRWAEHQHHTLAQERATQQQSWKTAKVLVSLAWATWARCMPDAQHCWMEVSAFACATARTRLFLQLVSRSLFSSSLPCYDDRECIWLEYGAMSTLLPSWFPATGRGVVHDVNSRYLTLNNSELHPTSSALFIPLVRTLLTSGSQMYFDDRLN